MCRELQPHLCLQLTARKGVPVCGIGYGRCNDTSPVVRQTPMRFLAEYLLQRSPAEERILFDWFRAHRYAVSAS